MSATRTGTSLVFDTPRTPIRNGPPRRIGLLSPEELLAKPAAEIRARLTGNAMTPPPADTTSPFWASRQPTSLAPLRQDADSVLADVLAGKLRIVTHPGTGQYTSGSVSGCGLAAMNAIRLVVESLESSTSGQQLLRRMMDAPFSRDATSICSQWTSAGHLSIDSIYSVPLFNIPISQVDEVQDSCGLPQFAQLVERLNELASAEHPAFAVITKSPEIVSLFSIVTGDAHVPIVNVVFDSHPRPRHPAGAGLILGPPAVISEYLSTMFRVDRNLMDDPSLSWQAELLSQFSAHIFLGRPIEEQRERSLSAMYDASLDLLRLKSEISASTTAAADLRNENRRLKERIDDMAYFSSQSQPARTSSYVDKGKRRAIEEPDPFSRATSPEVSEVWFPRLPPSRDVFIEAATGTSTSHQALSSAGPSRSDQLSYPMSSGSLFSLPLTGGSSRTSIKKTLPPVSDTSLAERMKEDYDREVSQIEYARQLQKQFDEEQRRLSEEYAMLLKTAQQTFDCSICLETHPEDALALLKGCSHKFCREDLQAYIKSKLDERLFPIYCPVCMAEKANDCGVVTHDLLFDMGTTEEQYMTFSELAIAQTSICVFCRGCKTSVYVDRADHDRMEILTCPWQTCQHMWCKSCQQTVEPGMRHSCDGSLELDAHMKSKGYRYCPGCRTPISRTEGCNHMTCSANGCNTHFCYRCGGLIIRTSKRSELQRALEQHYSRCYHFDEHGP